MLDKRVSKKTVIYFTLGSALLTASLGVLVVTIIWWNKVNINWGPNF